MSRCRFCAKKNPAKPTSTHTYWEKAIRVSRCKFGGINMFGGFHVLAGLLIKLRPENKVQSSGRRLECLGVPWPRIVSAGSSIKLRPEKKVQSSGHRLQCLGGSMSSDCFGGFVAMFFGGFLDQITNYDRKKGTVVWPLVGMPTTYFWLITP